MGTSLAPTVPPSGAPHVVNCSFVSPQEDVTDKDRHALLYIVITLLFYSLGIIVAIVMYLKREKEEIVEEKAYDDYMNFRSDPDKWARYFRVQKMISHLDRVEREKDRRQDAEERAGQTAVGQRDEELARLTCSSEQKVELEAQKAKVNYSLPLRECPAQFQDSAKLKLLSKTGSLELVKDIQNLITQPRLNDVKTSSLTSVRSERQSVGQESLPSISSERNSVGRNLHQMDDTVITMQRV